MPSSRKPECHQHSIRQKKNSKREDAAAIEEALCAGNKVITSIHGGSYEEIESSAIGDLIYKGVFDIIIFLSSDPVTGTVRRIMKSKLKGV